MRSPWMYITIFVVAVGLPNWAAYFVGQKYDDKAIFPLCLTASIIFVGGVLIFSYMRERRATKRHGPSE